MIWRRFTIELLEKSFFFFTLLFYDINFVYNHFIRAEIEFSFFLHTAEKKIKL